MFLDKYSSQNQEVWNKFCHEVNGDLELGKHTLYGRISYSQGPWELVLDTHFRAIPEPTEYTRVRAPFQNYDGFTCEIYNSSFSSEIGKLFGMQDVEIGYDYFDDEFIIKANDEARVWLLLKIYEVRRLIKRHSNIHLRVNSSKRFLSSVHPEGNDEIYLEIKEIITDANELRAINQLMLLLLNNLCKFDSVCTKNK